MGRGKKGVNHKERRFGFGQFTAKNAKYAKEEFG
jgi:hypothetical protein